MEHKGTRELRTGRLVLRRLNVDDAEAMFANWASDEVVTRYLTWRPHASVDETRALLEEWVESYARDDFYQWGIELVGVANGESDAADDSLAGSSASATGSAGPAAGTLVGTISVVGLFEGIEACEVGYCLGRAWWGRGIMTEALAAVCDFLFDEVGARRVCSYHNVDNPASGAVMLKCGLRFEGVRRAGALDKDGAPVDIACYGLLATDRPQAAETDQERRIAEAEADLARVEAANRLLELAEAEHARTRAAYERLSAYYGSDAWREDYATDEAGTLPTTLRRGVLSQDAAFDALTTYEQLCA